MPDYETPPSNLRPPPVRPRDFNPRDSSRDSSPRRPYEILGREVVETARKRLTFTRRANHNGEFLRIDEERAGGEHSAVIIPGDRVEEFFDALEKLFPDPAA